ncbi:MAG: hypothetical protein EHM13_11380 [Acidobacteria bacterium]|nr:MAG: hypothetical protein EHM13_11380 [Acidobacteriota bacterium]
MVRLAAVALILVLAGSAAEVSAATADDSAYARANARLARTVPHYPRARLLIEENVHGDVGVPFEAVGRISFLSRPRTQRDAMRFYNERLGSAWRRRGSACLVSRSRIVVVVVNPKRRRLGLLMDSRGATHCNDLTGLISDLLDVGYPDS